MSSNIRITKICEGCGSEFIAKTTVTRYCSQKCNSRDYKRKARESKILKAQEDTIKIKPQHFKEPDLNSKDILSIKESSLFIGISRNTIHRLFKDGTLKPTRIRGRVLITRKEIKRVFDI